MSALLHHRVGGDRRKPVLLLIHPMGADLTFWDACWALWADDFCLVAMDLIGAGKSPRLDIPHTIESHAADIEDLRAQLGFERVIPVGCAVGAMVAASYAGRHPESCQALVLSNPGLRTRPEASAMLAKRASDVRAGGMAAVVSGTMEAAFAGCPADRRRKAFERQFMQQDSRSYALAIEGMLDADVSLSLGGIVCPTLIVAGGKDGLLPPAEHACPLHAAVAGSELIIIDDAAHFIPYQRPEEFATLSAEFLVRRSAG